MYGKSCFFIGHREISHDIDSLLDREIERHISEYRVIDFTVGNYGAFDRAATSAVIKAKQRHPHIILNMLIAYHPSERKCVLPVGFDHLFYPPDLEKVPRRFAIVQANKYMVDHVDYLISYAWHPASNARNLTEYAVLREQRELIKVTSLRQ